MYDLTTAYLHETERRMDERADAANYHLAKECAKANAQTPDFSKYLPNLLAALVLFFVKRWS